MADADSTKLRKNLYFMKPNRPARPSVDEGGRCDQLPAFGYAFPRRQTPELEDYPVRTVQISLLLLASYSYSLAQLPEQLSLDFNNLGAYSAEDWIYASPTPLGVTRPDPNVAVSQADNSWNWTIADANEVLVGVYPSITLGDSSIEASFSFEGSEGIGVGLINRFGVVPNPNDPNGTPLAHGYCVLTSPETITLIDFDFARQPNEYVLPIAQVSTPAGLFDGSPTKARFQVQDAPSTSDPGIFVPQFDFWLGDTVVFEGVEDTRASWAQGWTGIDAWTVDPFAEKASAPLSIDFSSLIVSGISADANPSETIVVPPGFEALEGPSSIGGGAPSQFRFQWQYASSWFPQQEIDITELRFRRNDSTRNSEVVFSNLEVDASTHDGNLNSKFQENVGEDVDTVFEGDLVQGLPAEGDPRPFDIVVPFDEPFRYDPSSGDLLIDFKAHGGVNVAPFWDAGPVGLGDEQISFSSGVGASGFGEGKLPIAQFTFTSIGLNPDCNGDGSVDIADANCTAVEGLEAFLASIGSLPGDFDGSRLVEFADFLVLAENYGSTGEYTEGDIDKNGIVDFPDFLALADNFGKSGIAVASVPEPETATLGLLSIFTLLLRPRRSRIHRLALDR